MLDDDLNKGIRNIEEVLHRLDKRAQAIPLLKEPQQTVPAEKPIKIQSTESLPLKAKNSKDADAIIVDTPRPGETPPYQKSVETNIAPINSLETQNKWSDPIRKVEQQNIERNTTPQSDNEPVKRRSISRVKVLMLYSLCLIVVGIIYQFVYNTSKYQYKRALRYKQAGDMAKALSGYKKVTLKYPKSSEAIDSLYEIGSIQADEIHAEKAIDSFGKFIHASPKNAPKVPAAEYRIAELLFQGEHNYTSAKKALEALISPLGPKEWQEKGNALKQKVESAEKHLVDGESQLPANPDGAIDSFSAVLAIDPENPTAKSRLEDARQLQLIPVETGTKSICEICSEVFNKKIKIVNVQRRTAASYEVKSISGICSKCRGVDRKMKKTADAFSVAFIVFGNDFMAAKYMDPSGLYGAMQRTIMNYKPTLETLAKQAYSIDKNNRYRGITSGMDSIIGSMQSFQQRGEFNANLAKDFQAAYQEHWPSNK